MTKLQFLIDTTLFDGVKFTARYRLKTGDYTTRLQGKTAVITLRDGLVLPDNPPIFDPPADAATLEKEARNAAIDEPTAQRNATLSITAIIIDELNALRKIITPAAPDLKLEEITARAKATTPPGKQQ